MDGTFHIMWNVHGRNITYDVESVECIVWNVHGWNIGINVECTWTEHYD